MVLCISLLLYFIQRTYIPLSDHLQILDKDTKSALFTHNTDTAMEVEHVRAAQQQHRVISRALALLDNTQIPFYYRLDAKRWVDFMSDFASASIILVITTLCLYTNVLDAAKTGLAVSIITSISFRLGVVINLLANFRSMQSTLVYALDLIRQTPIEVIVPGSADAPRWPTIGSIELKNVTSRYEYVLSPAAASMTA